MAGQAVNEEAAVETAGWERSPEMDDGGDDDGEEERVRAQGSKEEAGPSDVGEGGGSRKRVVQDENGDEDLTDGREGDLEERGDSDETHGYEKKKGKRKRRSRRIVRREKGEGRDEEVEGGAME